MVTIHVIRHGFFAYLEDIRAPGDGFALFGPTHLIILTVLAVFIACMCAAYIRLEPRKRRVMLMVTALIVFALELAKQLTFPLIQGHYWVYQLPLHLCGLNIFLELIYAFFPNKTTGEILYALGLPGAVAALLFANWSMYPILNFYCLQSFIIHAFLIAFILMPLVSGELRPQAKNLWRVAAFLLVVVPLIYQINKRLGTNFFFVNAGSEGSPLEFFVNVFGNPGFLVPYAGLIIVAWFFMYLPWVLANRRSVHKKILVYK